MEPRIKQEPMLDFIGGGLALVGGDSNHIWRDPYVARFLGHLFADYPESSTGGCGPVRKATRFGEICLSQMNMPSKHGARINASEASPLLVWGSRQMVCLSV